jgi:hypothetical protein
VTKLETTIFIKVNNVLISKGVVVDPSNTEIYNVVQGDKNNEQAFTKKNV